MDATKWKVIQDWPQPANVKELQSFLGSINCLSKFIPNLSTFRKPLQDLLKSNNEFVWLKVHDEAFKTLKNAIIKDVTLKYFDSSLPMHIKTDAFKKGIGVIVLQPDDSVENTSCTELPTISDLCYMQVKNSYTYRITLQQHRKRNAWCSFFYATFQTFYLWQTDTHNHRS